MDILINKTVIANKLDLVGVIMESIYIDVPRDLTSYEFYNNLLIQREKKIVAEEQDIILDFSRTYRIEPLVVPNMLCFGYEFRKKYGNVAKIYIPDISYSGELKNYMNEIGFIKYAERFGLFEFITSPYGGLQGKKIDPICGTLYFDTQNSIDEINRGVEYCITPFAEQYLSKFESMHKCNDGIYYKNEITEFLTEMIINCRTHAKSFSFTTLHAKYSANKIYIAVSDFGCGFSNTIGLSEKCKDEVAAILAGVYRRKDSKVYGLYNVIRRVLEYDGKVRIHSNNVQIIFTPRILKSFLNEKLFDDNGFETYNVKRNLPFEGVHIEIELPLERGK